MNIQQTGPGSLRVYTVSLGCPKNRVDTENMLGGLGSAYRPAYSPQYADLVLVNTCGFIQPAVEESLETILELAESLREAEPKPLLVVTGCLPARYGHELREQLPEVDLWLSFQEQASWGRRIASRLNAGNSDAAAVSQRTPDISEKPRRQLSTSPGTAYLKINEGCRHHCSFCLIPRLRGPLISSPIQSLIQEAGELLDQGVREICIVAQDVTDYGRDLGLENGLQTLLEQLAPLPGLQWLRLMYLYPAGLSPELLRFLKELGPPFIPYFDLPLQHAHPDILKRMGRPFQVDPEAIIRRVRGFFPEACLRSTFITGFPGESEEHFQTLLRFVRTQRLHHVGVFPFSPEPGTPAASFRPAVPEAVREARREQLLKLQASISEEILAETLDRELDVLIERSDPEWPTLFQGRTWFQAPEVDGITYISSLRAAPGQLVRSRIEECRTYDLIALDESEP